MFKAFLKDYLTFNRKDRIGLITLLFLIVIAFILPKLYKPPFKDSPVVIKSLKIVKDSSTGKMAFGSDEQYPIDDPYISESRGSKSELFDFDPNTVSAIDLQRLGMEKRTIKTLLNYRNKGGRFTKPEDLTKVWGLNPVFYERVKGYIQIPALKTEITLNEAMVYTSKPKTLLSVDINVASQADFIALPGIGEKLSARIINFRDKLGGFYSIEQVAETYALPDSTFQKIKPLLRLTSGDIRKINLNQSTKDELKAHPYIRWNLANAIIEYRSQHGNFNKMEDLKAINIIDEATYNKIIPYLSL